MGDTPKGSDAVRIWYGFAAAGVLLPILLLASDGWLARQWVGDAPVGTAGALWWHMMALPLIIGIPAMVALVALCLIAARQAGRETVAQAALQAETQHRQTAEEALRHAQKMEAVGRLTGGIAHDFNNHLTVISSNVELLKRRLPRGTPEPARLADAAMQGVRRAAALTQRLLAFSRQQTLDPEPLDAGHLVSGMLELLRRTLGEKIAIDTASTRGLWLTRTDANQLESALLNLAVNARDAMPSGGRLTIETANETLEESDAAGRAELTPGQYVMIAVRDTGMGMSSEVRARALEPFFTTRPAGEGSGLGLSMVQSFVRQSGGLMRIETAPDKGTVIRLYLPRFVVPASPSAAAVDDGHHMSGETATVLVVEDDDPVRSASAEALREIGYEVLEAPDAMEAVRVLADRGGIDLLFTDIGLPGGVNGRALADAARNIHPTLKVLFTTGYKRDAILRLGLSQDDEHFLPKPFTLEQLEAKVRMVLNMAADAVIVRTEPAS